jgi:hypothetical protein
LERAPATARKLDEEERRDLVLVALNSQFEGDAGAEMFNGSGKTDVLVRVDDKNIFIGEFKIWRGPAAFREAIDQLLGYIVWRDSKAALVVFIENVSATDLILKARAEIRDHSQCLRVVRESDVGDRCDYVFRSTSDGAKEVRIAFLPVVIPPDAAGSTQKTN